MSATLVTYGGGEILKNIFNAIAMLMNNQSASLFQPLALIAASVGGAWVLIRTLFAPSLESFLGRYFFPFLGVIALMMVPSQTVTIEDMITGRSHRVEHVPFLLAQISQTISSLGYRITTAIDTVMHTPSDVSYSSTGMLFGSNTFIDAHDYKVSSAETEQNLKRISKQCVIYDLAMGLYDVEELRKSTNVLGFLSDKTSKARLVKMCKEGKCTTKSCKQAVTEIQKLLGNEAKYYSSNEVLKNLPLAFQSLTGIQKESEELITQQLVINTFKDEYAKRDGFATARAQLQQRSTYRILGSLAANSLVSLRAVLEALLYASFIFIGPLAFLPGGFRYLGNWVWMIAWIQMWPPFFSILSYVMQTVAQVQAASILTGLSQDQLGLSFFTSRGLSNLYADMFALSGFISASIPYVSYAVLQGGVGSFIHLASSMLGPVQTAASYAATEQVTGNYSYGNASMGQTSYQNTTAFQKQMSPSLSQGAMQFNDGVMKTTYAGGRLFAEQNRSNLIDSMHLEQSYQSFAQQSLNHANGVTEERRESVVEGISSAARHAADMTHHISSGLAKNEGMAERLSVSDQETVRSFEAISKQYSDQHSMDEREASQTLLKAGGCNWFFGAEASKSGGATDTEAMAWVESNNLGSEIGQMWQLTENKEKMLSLSETSDEMSRVSSSLAKSFDTLHSYQDQYSKALQESTTLQDLVSESSSESAALKRDLTQGFVDHLWSTRGEKEAKDLLTNPSRFDERASVEQSFLSSFVSSRYQSKFDQEGLNDRYSAIDMERPEYTAWSASVEEAKQDYLDTSGITAPDPRGISGDFNKQAASFDHQRDEISEAIGFDREAKQAAMKEKSEEWLLATAARKTVTDKDLEEVSTVCSNIKEWAGDKMHLNGIPKAPPMVAQVNFE